jgi:hypothetical protein
MFRKSHIMTLLTLLSAVQIAAAEDNLSADAAKDWKLLGSGREVTSSAGYCFRNNTLGQSIKYGKRGALGGINLVWDKAANLTNAHFENESGQGAIKYGEKIAFKIDGISTPFLRYEHRNLGINLGWSGKPVFEWVIVGGKQGDTIKVGERFGLINIVEKDFLVYAKRGGEAINLRWYIDRNKGGYLDSAKRATLDFLKEDGMKYAALLLAL